MDTIQHNLASLYNLNESSITSVQHKHTKILGLKGKCQISSLQSTEQGSLVTVVTCRSPMGHFIPLLLVFPRKNMKQELMNGTLPGSIHAQHPSGWIQSRIFTQWFLPVIKHTKLTKEDPVVLVLDGHYSHTRNLEVITLAQVNHVDIICLLRHSSHKMQLMDKAFMGTLKTFYCQEIEK
jgi:DDE superfamily endonuclease.